MTEPSSATAIGPKDVVELMRKGLFGDGGVEFADDAVYETPFGLPGTPRRFEGREAIYAHFAQRRADELAAAMRNLDITGTDAVVYESADPEVVTFEFELSGTSRLTGDAFRFTSTIGVLTVRGGQIVRWRDYPNFIGGAEATGALAQLADMITT